MGCTQCRGHNIVFVKPGDYIFYQLFKGKLMGSILFPYHIRNNIFLQPEPRDHVLKLIVLAQRGSDKLELALLSGLLQAVEHLGCCILVKQSSFMRDNVVITRFGNMNSVILHFYTGVGRQRNGKPFNLIYLRSGFLRNAWHVYVINGYLHLLRSDDHVR